MDTYRTPQFLCSLLFSFLGLLLPAHGNGVTTYHVSPSGSDDAAGTSWLTAKQTIQAGVDAAVDGDIVLVTNGLYATGGRTIATAGATTNRVVIDRAITVTSVNGPAVTIIQGAWDPTDPLTNGIGPAAVRGVYLGTNAVLSGFTVTNGATQFDDIGGGGIHSEISGVVSNCVISGNRANSGGGGVYGGTVRHSIISGNRAEFGGGGLCNANADNCLILYNTSPSEGISYFLASAATYLFYGPTPPELMTLVNCTIVNNASAPGGLLLAGSSNPGKLAVRNCVMWDNVNDKLDVGGAANDIAADMLVSNCYRDDSKFFAITNDPQFVDSMAGNYQLKWTSPCRDAGSNNFVASATDLLGLTRIVGASVDIGAYEAVNSDTDQLSDAEEAKYGTNPLLADSDSDGLYDHEEVYDVLSNPLLGDSDGDGFPDKFEWDNGYSPTNNEHQVLVDYIAGSGGTLGLFAPGTNDQFLVTFAMESSTNLPSFTPFPITEGQIQVNGEGALEFSFPGTNGVQFFRLQSE